MNHFEQPERYYPERRMQLADAKVGDAQAKGRLLTVRWKRKSGTRKDPPHKGEGLFIFYSNMAPY